MKFLNLKTKEIKEAYSIEVKESSVHVIFTKGGREYKYNSNTIQLIETGDINHQISILSKCLNSLKIAIGVIRILKFIHI